MRVNDEIFSRDLYANGMVIIAALFVIALLLINPPSRSETAKPLGNIVIMITWPQGTDDVDLWALGPGEPHAVGYSAKSGVVLDLLRDDLGMSNDVTPFNYETTISRGIIPGEYIINVHCYRCATLPIPVSLEVDVNDGKNNSATRRLIEARVELDRDGQEKTMIRFRLDKDGYIVPGTMNALFKPLRDVMGGEP